MRSNIVQTAAGAAIVACLVTACGSDGTAGSGASAGPDLSSSSGTAAPQPPGQGAGDAARQVSASIEQALQQAPITFAPEKADLPAQATQALGQIAKALQGNSVKISVATHAGYPDAGKAKTLSEKRAEAITSALEGLGVGKDRVVQDASGNEKAQGAEALDTQISVAQ
ncbi:OmpA family protein [Amycolatopsis australiensis]|uniref:Outer membrane protein OmpA n=1 Tax=Amycolatopsis australiensis TaxID=546364 RepID=A0A1K1SPA4_9PSEU|nr:OmpA family protein [Amycolatopsis australiensis]SFW86248.1 Outer membrane protein OmpA [Amycolatopsis australiensis]